MKLWLLSGGLIDLDRSVIHPGDDSHRHITVPCMQVLIETEGQRILVDTGMPPVAAGDPLGLQREYEIDPAQIKAIVRDDERVDRQLQLAGVDPATLDLVINTHFHFDHAGGNVLFPGVPIAAQDAEFQVAQERGETDFWDAPGLHFRSVMGDWSPLPGVEMLLTPGHTPGHQSMLVHLEEGPWLFTWDAVYTEEHWRTGKLGAVEDVAAARSSIERLHAIAHDTGARIIFGHDIAQWEALGMEHVPRRMAIA